jgi:hypothetical protein
MNYNHNFINLNIIYENLISYMKNYEKYTCSWSKRSIYTPSYRPLHHVTIFYLKKCQSPPQGNGPFFDPYSGTKRHVTVGNNPSVRTSFLLLFISPLIV